MKGWGPYGNVFLLCPSPSALLALRAGAEHLKPPLDVILQGEVVHVLHDVGVGHSEDAGAQNVTVKHCRTL